jgi:SAM-dependent methyltransferase
MAAVLPQADYEQHTGPLRYCRVCDSGNLEQVIDLGPQPWCSDFISPEKIGTEPYYPLCVVQCQDCRTAQLNYTVPREVLFGSHPCDPDITKPLRNHFARVAVEVDAEFQKCRIPKSILDIGSRDGTQLEFFKKLGYSVLGIELSQSRARIANDKGIDTIQDFFDYDLAISLRRKFDLINAAGIFFHLEDLHSVTDGIRECLKPEGILVVQFFYMKQIMQNLAFNQIYHEHLLYYNLATMEALMGRHGLSMYDAYVSPIHGGSIVGLVTHAGKKDPSKRLTDLLRDEEKNQSNTQKAYMRFASDIAQKKEENLEFLHRARQENKRVFGLGAPVKGNTLLNYFGINSDQLECLVEKNEQRRGLYSPGTHIPVVLDRELQSAPDIYYVLDGELKQEVVMPNVCKADQAIDFYFPVNS